MKIIFSQFFDQGYYINRLKEPYKSIFNISISGTIGFLNILEREAGNSGNYPPQRDRQLLYNEILKKYLKDHPQAFYSKSFTADPIGVTKEMLNWRDQLVLAKWNSSLKGVSLRFDTLSEIEGLYSIPIGIEDRWIAVLNKISQKEFCFLSIEKIEIEDQIECLHPFFIKLFEVLTQKRIEIEYKNEKYSNPGNNNLSALKRILENKQTGKIKLNPNDITSLQILEFRNNLEAAEFICSQKKVIEKSIILNQDGFTLNLVQNSFGDIVSGADISPFQPQVLQIMHLASSLFIKPLNIYNLISYLQISVHPLPLGLRHRLLRVIGDYGGIPKEKWEKVITDYPFENEKARKAKIIFAKLWNSLGESLNKDQLINFYNSLADWARKRANSDRESDELLKRELSEMDASCKALVDSLKNMDAAEINLKELELLIGKINEPLNVKIYREQRNSTIVIQRPGQLISNTEQLIWLDFYNHNIVPEYYSFLNEQESTDLKKNGLDIWDKEFQAAGVLNEYKKAILYTNDRVVLVKVEKHADEDTQEHPLFSYMKANIDNLEEITFQPEKSWKDEMFSSLGFIKPELEEVIQVSLPGAKAVHEFTSGNLVKLRETESYSSLEKLIDFPFDWVFEYIAEIRPGKLLNPEDIQTLKGKVAHSFIEELFTKSGKNLASAKEFLKNDFEEMFYKSSESYGAQLLLEQHKFEYTLFKAKLKASVIILLDLIEVNSLEIDEMEFKTEESPGILNNQKFIAFIDLLLKNSKGNYIVFDLKWTRSDEKYRKMITNSRAIQLALYKSLLNKSGKNVDKLAYYSLASGKLITSYDFSGDNIIRVNDAESEENTLVRLENSVLFRLQQIQNGIIEESEEMTVEGLDYFKSQETNILIELPEYKGLKSKNFYSGISVLKGKIK